MAINPAKEKKIHEWAWYPTSSCTRKYGGGTSLAKPGSTYVQWQKNAHHITDQQLLRNGCRCVYQRQIKSGARIVSVSSWKTTADIFLSLMHPCRKSMQFFGVSSPGWMNCAHKCWEKKRGRKSVCVCVCACTRVRVARPSVSPQATIPHRCGGGATGEGYPPGEGAVRCRGGGHHCYGAAATRPQPPCPGPASNGSAEETLRPSQKPEAASDLGRVCRAAGTCCGDTNVNNNTNNNNNMNNNTIKRKYKI